VASRPGTPAEKAGLRPGDLVRSIDERHTRSMPAVVADRLLRGAPGSSVKLGILRAGTDPFDVTLVRERVLPAAPTSRMIEPGTGLVRVSDFTPATAEDVRTELAALERAGAERLLLDLRSAAWGPNEAGARLAELFLPGGPVAKVVGRRAEDRLLEADPARTAWTKPLVVLVDNGTAGPGEIAAAALLDAGRGPLVGRRTFGRAAVSKAVPLPEGALLLTVAKYMSPKGTSIHGEGVQPTVAVASAREEDDEDRPEGEAAPDRVLEKGLEVVRAEVAKARG
jgi:carboxyl-terminal processing protease